MRLPNSENSTADASRGSTHLPSFPNDPESDDDAASTSKTVDPKHPVELSLPRVASADRMSLDLPESTCGGFIDSEEDDSMTSDGSEVYSFLEEPEGLRWYYVKYSCLTRRLRNNGYFLPFDLVWLALTIASCYMGAYYWPMCPADEYIPRYVFFSGAVGTYSLCVEIVDSLWKLCLRQSAGNGRYFCAFGLGWVAIITTVFEMIQFYTMSYSFHRSDENYCNETFYLFVFYKNIAFGALLFLTAMLCIPSFNYGYYHIYFWV